MFLDFLLFFGDKAGEFIETGDVLVMCFFTHYLVKFGEGCSVIRFDEKDADAAGNSSENDPADERKGEPEDIEFFAVGHFLGKFEGAFGIHSGIFSKDIGDHPILIGFDDSGDDEKKAPEEYLKIHQEHDFYYVKIVSAFEYPEKAADFGTGDSVFHKESVHANKNRISDEDVEKEREKNKNRNGKGDKG